MARMIVLRRAEGSTWEHVGAVDVDVQGDWDADKLARAQRLAVEQKAMQGVFTAIPFEFWHLFEAEAQVTVKPVPTLNEPRPVSIDDTDDEEFPSEDDPDLEGLTQGPKLP